jgi:hypothetical protein
MAILVTVWIVEGTNRPTFDLFWTIYRKERQRYGTICDLQDENPNKFSSIIPFGTGIIGLNTVHLKSYSTVVQSTKICCTVELSGRIE